MGISLLAGAYTLLYIALFSVKPVIAGVKAELSRFKYITLSYRL